MFQRTFTYNKLREKIHTSNLTKKKGNLERPLITSKLSGKTVK